ncbi:unnamed protein product [Penicillium salamii]|uniref:BTB domain-containing protein n=1 Tax=Penicillium salamii TaxID=1612424 RepID=A0A9W4IFQ8_9EURO|nr:unnamed protein product [Penicillium salamii]CAG8137393.1 unnamed protein product [Penicillium salamii]CAG8137648.1 unnamed protein product [Penicillium salamii]CAG8172628.1 unnamed protein product [Penicillium salamii]CAG8268475.1 unnamed protein product [Penicillium salamii]
MRHDPTYSDLTVVCGGDEYAVHKCIVCTRSTFFAKACDCKFKVRHHGGGEMLLSLSTHLN